MLRPLLRLLIFRLHRGQILVQAVLLGDAGVEVGCEFLFLADKLVILGGLLFGLQAKLRPFLLHLLRRTPKLEIFPEAKHILEIVADGLCEHILFEKLARLHGVEKEIFAQFLRQVGLDYLVDLLLVFGALLRRCHRAVDKHVAVHVQADALKRFSGRV